MREKLLGAGALPRRAFQERLEDAQDLIAIWWVEAQQSLELPARTSMVSHLKIALRKPFSNLQRRWVQTQCFLAGQSGRVPIAQAKLEPGELSVVAKTPRVDRDCLLPV